MTGGCGVSSFEPESLKLGGDKWGQGQSPTRRVKEVANNHSGVTKEEDLLYAELRFQPLCHHLTRPTFSFC